VLFFVAFRILLHFGCDRSQRKMSVIEATAANAGTLFQALEPHKLGVCFFWASFHPESDRDGRLDRVFSALARSFAGVSFYKVEGDQHEEIAEKFQVHVIPTFVFVSRSAAGGEVTVLDRVTGANPRDLKAKIKELAEQLQQKKRAAEAGGANKSDGDDSTGTPTTQSIASLINASHVVLFMDGIPESPKSDPSAKAVALLQECEFKFGHYDIQEDSDGHVRRALGELCGTVANADGTFIPQLFVGGKLIGNHERMAELHSDKALAKLKPVVTPALDLNSYLEQLINKDEVMLFMKGTPQEPRCGFSRKMVALLQDNGISTFGSFNILTDEAVRAGLKTYSNWYASPTRRAVGKSRASHRQYLNLMLVLLSAQANVSATVRQREVGWWSRHCNRNGRRRGG